MGRSWEQHTCEELQVQGVDETHLVARILARHLRGGLLLGVSGCLGAGKTEFIRGLGRELGVTEDITSPTFVLEAVYDIDVENGCGGRLKRLCHWDLYRLERGSVDLDLLDYPEDPSSIAVVEWPERVAAVEDLLRIRVMLRFPESAGWGSGIGGREDYAMADSGRRVISITGDLDAALRRDLRSSGLARCDKGV